jgi:hypothetical protein
MNKLLKIIKIMFWAVIILGLVGLGVGGYFINKKIEELKLSVLSSDYSEQNIQSVEKDKTPDIKEISCTDACRNEIEEIVSNTVLDVGLDKTEKIIETKTIVTDSSGTDYVALGSTSSTTSMDWVTLEETGVYINLENDYGKDAAVSWDVTLKVAHANGQAFARLYDATNNIAVDYSELTTTDNADYLRVGSGNLPFWRGRNLYKVQIKSLNSFEITYGGGNIKIIY